MAGRTAEAAPDAYEVAIRLLAQRAHGTAELARKLEQKGCAREDVEEALVRLRDSGYLDDDAFAASLVRRRVTQRGRVAIAAELREKGLSQEVVARALADVDAEVELQAAQEFAERSGRLEPERLAGRLQRRGFAANVIRAVLRMRRES
ncbi:MAG TPA: regulatory protein RecX [Candidatus Dormibacteraeota bacterium]|jgi:regulatory protein|nr:regulatory protein RecX [Candidatus Dormibacteraeota bacterium]